MTKVLGVDRCLEPYLPEKGSLEDVKSSYRQAVKDVHPDQGGHSKALKRVNESSEKLKNLMGENEVYKFKGKRSPKIKKTKKKTKKKQAKKTKKKRKRKKKRKKEEISLEECWRKGLEQANRLLDSEYELVDYSSRGKHCGYGRFEDGSNPSFAIELEKTDNKVRYQTTYFEDTKGKIDNYRETKIIHEAMDLESYFQRIAKTSAQSTQNIEPESRSNSPLNEKIKDVFRI